MMVKDVSKLLERQQYRIHNGHAAVKLCHWMRQSLLKGRHCYKQEFYGIQSHRCLQMTPVVNQCTHNCLFCWRVQGFESEPARWADPEEVLDVCIEQQKALVSGFGGDPRCSLKMWKESQQPSQVAISLSGEPTMYPYLGGFIEACQRKGMTTFLVSNGTYPKVLENLDPLPTQLYITVAAPNEQIYRRLCVPKIEDGWSRLRQTLELMPSLSTRTVIRHTLVKDWNIGWEEEYAKLDSIADPTFIEPKGYVFVGDSRRRMTIDNMPSHAMVTEFGRRIGERLGLKLLMQKEDSRVVLLGKEGAKVRITTTSF